MTIAEVSNVKSEEWAKFFQNYRWIKILRSGRFDRSRHFQWAIGLLTLRTTINRT